MIINYNNYGYGGQICLYFDNSLLGANTDYKTSVWLVVGPILSI